MVKRTLSILIVVLLAFIMAGCKVSGPVTVSLEGDREISLSDDRELVIKLDSNPTTGYSWGMKEAINDGVITQIGKSEYAPASELIGSGGIQTYRFKALKIGRAELVFEYMRPWEKEKAPAKKYIVRIVVR